VNHAAALRHLAQHPDPVGPAASGDDGAAERMAALLRALGDPHEAYPIIRVEGGHGRSSVARMITGLLREAGLAVGTASAVHVEALNERIAYDAEPIGDAELGLAVGAVAAVQDLVGVTPTASEIVTAAALAHFADVAVDVAVVAAGAPDGTGPSSSLPATVTVLTDVAGASSSVRRTRAAALVEGLAADTTLVCGEDDPDLHDVLAASPAERTWWREDDLGCDQHVLALGGRAVTLRTPFGTIDDVLLPVHGEHQAENAAVALAAAEAFFDRQLEDDIVRHAFIQTTLPARFEIVHREPTVVLDAAQDVAEAERAAATLTEEFTLSGTLIYVCAFGRGTDVPAVLDALGARDAGFLIACGADAPESIPAPEVASAADALGIVAESMPDVDDAVQRALALAGPDDLVLVVGPHALVGSARAQLRQEVDAR
jgi:dihydrofolate synthase/folylpolyglutamate synthase